MIKRQYVRLLPLLLGGGASSILGAIDVRPEGASPAAAILRDIAGGRVTSDRISAAVSQCTLPGAPSRWGSGCSTRLADVLLTYAESGAAARQTVREGIRRIRGERGTPLSAAVRSIPEQLESPHANYSDSGRVNSTGGKWYIKAAGGEGPPKSSDIGRLPISTFEARLLTFLSGLLSGDPKERVKEALEAASADDCETSYKGRAREVCEDLGPARIMRGSLWLAFDDLADSRGDLDVLSRYLDVDRRILTAAVERGELSGDEGLTPYMMLMRRWMKERPTRWQAWADIEETLRPR
jgi:hypothetical protein